MANSTKRRIEVSLGKTINLGDYESMRVDVTYAADLKDKEDAVEAYESCWELVDRELSKKIEQIEGRKNRTGRGSRRFGR